jgi:hypothetical protein
MSPFWFKASLNFVFLLTFQSAQLLQPLSVQPRARD